jgi:hypothetical protein
VVAMALNLELLRKDYLEAISHQIVEEFWVPDFGENTVRILPPKDGERFYREVGVHYRLVGSGMEFCPRVCRDLSCPICEVVDELKKMKTSVAVQIVSRLAVVTRFLMNVIPIKEDAEKDIRQYLSPKSVWLGLLKIILDPEYGDITDLHTGRNVVIEKIQATGGFVNYSVRPKLRQTSVKEILGRDLKLEDIPDLDDVINRKLKGYDELKVILYGSEEDLGMDVLMERYSKPQTKEKEEVSEDKKELLSVEHVLEATPKKGQSELERMIAIANEIVKQLKGTNQ